MYGLGRLYNAMTSATTAATPWSMIDCATVTIFAIGATSGNATIQQLTAASGGTAVNYDGSDAAHGAGITKYYRWNNGLWTAVTQAAAATFTCGTGGLAACEINEESLSDGYKYLSVSHGTASFVVVQGALEVQRYAPNLRSNIA